MPLVCALQLCRIGTHNYRVSGTGCGHIPKNTGVPIFERVIPHQTETGTLPIGGTHPKRDGIGRGFFGGFKSEWSDDDCPSKWTAIIKIWPVCSSAVSPTISKLRVT